MSDYQVIARKFRPPSFKEVIGQDAIVITLKNAIKFNRLAQAYLFCGSKGTGKTTLARLFAKALNCQQLTSDYEPCNQCVSCREIISGSSLNVLEIDGATNRGIEDIKKQITETVGYATASGCYRIFIIDEVHMLTKEAFNALLKTLEEPPPKVKFFFATTEPHKVLPTILSRCQRFNLQRIPLEKIIKKLQLITQQLGVEVEEGALNLLAQQAEGSLRDAESLLDQVIAFGEGKISLSLVTAILGLVSQDAYFELDRAGKEGNLVKAFEIVDQVFSQGKDLTHFIEGLVEHFRTILLIKLAGKDSSFLTLSQEDRDKYDVTTRFYTQEQCLTLIEYLIEAQNQMRFAPSGRVALETILLHIMRSHFQLSVEFLVRRLAELEQTMTDHRLSSSSPHPVPISPANSSAKSVVNQETSPLKSHSPPSRSSLESMSVDPTPTLTDLGVKKNTSSAKPPSPVVPLLLSPSTSGTLELEKKPSYHYDTLFQFAAVELEGRIQRNSSAASH